MAWSRGQNNHNKDNDGNCNCLLVDRWFRWLSSQGVLQSDETKISAQISNILRVRLKKQPDAWSEGVPLPLAFAYLQFQSLDLFLQNLFSRVWILNDDVRNSTEIVKSICYDPQALAKSRGRLCILSKESILLEQILGYLEEALGMMGIPPEPPEQVSSVVSCRFWAI